jgi:glycosyltransferase involved in cell wall biosynthesis
VQREARLPALDRGGARMKLLISAYACEPGKGSEPAVGWNWVQALVRRGFQVYVITRSNNRDAIESVAASRLPALTFHYYDLPGWARRWKHWPGGIYLYYLLWQRGAYGLAKRLHAAERFDRVHHVTFASYRQPSFMGGLGIPFIFGPVGGGETMPAQLRRGLSGRGRLAEMTRNCGNSLIAFDPFMRSTFSHAEIIACTTAETMARIPRRYRKKCAVQLAIGINKSEIDEPAITATPAGEAPTPRFLFVGRLLYWKGLHLVLRALPEVRRAVPGVTLKIIGTGDDGAWLDGQARAAGVSDLLEWVPSTPHDEVAREYRESLALVFPSLHDSGGMVVLESLAAGLPVICLDLGGPGTIATPDCAVIIPTQKATEAAVVQALAAAMIRIATDASLRARLAANAPERAKQLTWDRAADNLYASIERDPRP